MLTKLFLAFSVMAICVAIHAVGLTVAFRYLRRANDDSPTFWRSTRLLIAVAGCAVLVHTIEIAVWAVFYCYLLWHANDRVFGPAFRVLTTSRPAPSRGRW